MLPYFKKIFDDELFLRINLIYLGLILTAIALAIVYATPINSPSAYESNAYYFWDVIFPHTFALLFMAAGLYFLYISLLKRKKDVEKTISSLNDGGELLMAMLVIIFILIISIPTYEIVKLIIRK